MENEGCSNSQVLGNQVRELSQSVETLSEFARKLIETHVLDQTTRLDLLHQLAAITPPKVA